MQRHLNDTLMAELARSVGSGDLLEWIEERTAELSSIYWSKDGGMSLSQSFLRRMRITDVAYSSLQGSAILRPTGAGYQIVVKTGLPPETMRFAIAHEIGHAFFVDTESTTRSLNKLQWAIGRDPTVEHLCDRFAAALLIPLGQLRQSIEDHSVKVSEGIPPLHLIRVLASEFRVPEQAMAKRICHDLYQTPVAIVCLRPTQGEANAIKWRTSWCALPFELHMAYQVDGIRIPLKTSGRVIPSTWLPDIDEGERTVHCKLER